MRGAYRPSNAHLIRLRTAKQFEVAGEIDVGDPDAQFRGRWQVASAGFDQKFFQFAQDARSTRRESVNFSGSTKLTETRETASS
jgi:hypothetical protein